MCIRDSLAVSASLAILTDGLAIDAHGACDAVLAGYTEGLAAGGDPFVLAERHAWLREAAEARDRDPVQFWQKLEALPTADGPLPAEVHAALEAMLPERGLPWRAVHRRSGLGSLGRPRWAALVPWRGGLVAREAKAIAGSACVWAAALDPAPAPLYPTLLNHAVRCADPFVKLQGCWVVRRLAPDCSRIELGKLNPQRDEQRLLYAMGRETANIHLATTAAAQAAMLHLRSLPGTWLRDATAQMQAAIQADWEAWRAAPAD